MCLEHDWVFLANQKLDSYERSLLDHADSGAIQIVRQRSISFGYALRYSFYLITTIGTLVLNVCTNFWRFRASRHWWSVDWNQSLFDFLLNFRYSPDASLLRAMVSRSKKLLLAFNLYLAYIWICKQLILTFSVQRQLRRRYPVSKIWSLPPLWSFFSLQSYMTLLSKGRTTQ